MYKLVNIETGETVTTAEAKVQFGGPWGALDAEDKPRHVWEEIIPTVYDLRQEKFGMVNNKYQARLAKMRETLAIMQAQGLDTAALKASYAAAMVAYKAELADVCKEAY